MLLKLLIFKVAVMDRMSTIERARVLGVILLVACFPVVASAQGTTLEPGETISFSSANLDGTGRNVTSCTGELTTCEAKTTVEADCVVANPAGCLAGDNAVTISVEAPGADQFGEVVAGRDYGFSVPDSEDSCASDTFSAHVQATVRFHGNVMVGPHMSAPGAPVTNVEVKALLAVRNLSTNSDVLMAEVPIAAPPPNTTVGLMPDGSRLLTGSIPVVRGDDYQVSLLGLFIANCVNCENGAAIAFAPASVSPLQPGFFRAESVEIIAPRDVAASVCTLQNSLEEHDMDIKALLEEHDMDVKDLLAILQEGIDFNREAILEAIRLINTPQGRRSTDLPACDGAGCDFPENPRQVEPMSSRSRYSPRK